MAQFPALPFWTDSYLADTRHLSTEEHGAYLLLLMEAWRRPECSLPDNDAMLARLAGLPMASWLVLRDTIMSFWTRDGRKKEWTQKRLLKERQFVTEKSRSQRDKAAKRWKEKEKTDATVMPKGMPEGCPADAPTPTPIIREDTNVSSLSEPAVPDHSKPSKRKTYPEDFEAAWKAYPRTQNMSKAEALPHWGKLSPEDRELVIRSVPNYISFLKSKPDLEVIHFCRYLSKRRFEGHAGAAQDTTPDWPKRLAYARTHKVWPVAEWGPMPGRQGCTVPSKLLAPGDGAGWSEHQRVA